MITGYPNAFIRYIEESRRSALLSLEAAKKDKYEHLKNRPTGALPLSEEMRKWQDRLDALKTNEHRAAVACCWTRFDFICWNRNRPKRKNRIRKELGLL